MKVVEYIKIGWDWILDIPQKIGETYSWISEAFSNWDMELYEFKDQAVYLGHKIGQFILLVIDKGKQLFNEMQNLVQHLLDGLKGWR